MNINEPQGGLALPGMKKHEAVTPTQRRENQRLKAVSAIPDGFRKHFVSFCGEFVGTFLFLFFAFAGTQVANTPTTNGGLAQGPTISNIFYIAAAFGFSLLVNVWIFFRITGGVFNPAVTFALCLIGAVPWLRGLVIFIAQILGAIVAAAVVSGLLPTELRVHTGLSDDTSVTRGLFIEMFLTAELIFTIFMLAAEKSRATFVAPVGIGLALFIAELAGVYYTGGSLNPARSFGPDVVNGNFDGYHWIYWIGPFLGALLAVAFYKFVKGLEYETVNPGADSDHDMETFRNDEDPARGTTARPYDGSSSVKTRLSERGSKDENV